MEIKIKVTYETGNSFGIQIETHIIDELSWENMLVVKENLNRIVDHYKADKGDALYLKSDRGEEVHVNVLWAKGYFESLERVEAVLDLPAIDVGW